MKIWLINPPTRADRRMGINGVVDTLFYNSPPLGLASLAAVLEQDGHAVVITDAPALGLYRADLVPLARQIAPDVVGITATTSYVHSALASAELLRPLLPRALVCLGGPHVTGSPQLLLDQPAFDLAVIGEGELTLRDVVRAVEAGCPWADIPGVVSVLDGRLHRAPPRPVIQDLDTLPLPARHLLPMHAYRPMPNDQRALPKASMIASRGCPFACIFCEKVVFGQHYRAVSPGRLVQEMHHLADRWGARDIAIVDSTFTPDRPRTLAVLDAMEKRPPPVSWTASCRANLLDRGILERMRALGCWRIRIAIESGNDHILRTIRKGITKEAYAETVHLADSLGFSVKGFFMVGHIGETAATLQESIDFACSLQLDDITVQVNTPPARRRPVRHLPRARHPGRRGPGQPQLLRAGVRAPRPDPRAAPGRPAPVLPQLLPATPADPAVPAGSGPSVGHHPLPARRARRARRHGGQPAARARASRGERHTALRRMSAQPGGRRALAIQLAASVAILALLVAAIPGEELRLSLRGLAMGWLLAAFPLKLALVLLHELRLYLPLGPWPRATLRRVMAIGFTAGLTNIALPMRGGDVLAITLLRQECGVPAASGTVAVGLASLLEALVFGLALLALLVLQGPALAVAHPPLAALAETSDLTWLLAALTVGAAGAVGVLRVLHRRRDHAPGGGPGPLTWLAEAGRGLGALRLAANVALAGLQTALVFAIWLCLFRAVGIDVEHPYATAALVQAAGSALVAVLPQGFGAGPTAATIFVLGALGVASAPALAVAGLAWGLHVIVATAIGALPTWHRLGVLGGWIGGR
ncbi:MAG: cobalamin-dependent protein [Pseudomonadota bacterium]